MPKIVERPVLYRRAYMALTMRLTGKTKDTVRKAVYRIEKEHDLEGIEGFVVYLNNQIERLTNNL